MFPVLFYLSSHAISQLSAYTTYCQFLLLWMKYITVKENSWLLLIDVPLPSLCRFCLRRSAVKAVMARLSRFSGLVLIIVALVPRPTLGCPSGCRCYSLTVECGSLGVKEIPFGVPSVTEVSRPIS